MTVASIEFLLCLLLAAAVFFHLPPGRTRRAALAAANLAFLGTLLPNLAAALALAVFLLSGYAVAMAVRARPRRALLAAYLAALLAAFVLVQRYAFLEPLVPARLLEHPIAIAGLSYMLFRQIHFLVDALQEQIPEVSLWSYVNYQTNLFALLAGPIQRYQDFHKYWRDPAPILAGRHEILGAWLRVFLGVVKIAGVAAVLLFARDRLWSQLLEAASAPGHAGGAAVLLKFALVFYLYPAYVYFNFVGYCDIVIGGATLFGQRLPENFDRPYLSRNILDFWTRWHRTLGFWVRDYLFMPMYKAIAERAPRQAGSLAFACYFVAFLLAGMWHGTTASFAVFGLLHGLGASAAKVWEALIIRRSGRPGLRRYLDSQPARWTAIFATGHYVCFSMLFFSAELGECRAVLGAVGAALFGTG
jgi:D-alanyl-lipoteichoic acid acyltransferase DltB (MBOAT superfamily)